jgi:ATP-dependent RNA helicase DDX19/DBP5
MKSKKHEISLLHGNDMEHQERDRVIDAFRKGATRVLITTNVLSRGLSAFVSDGFVLSVPLIGVDVLQVSLVVNFDVPLNAAGLPDFETYLHRIGRSARYGNSGTNDAFSVVHFQTDRI